MQYKIAKITKKQRETRDFDIKASILKKRCNLIRLKNLAALKCCWDGCSANTISPTSIEKARQIINAVNAQPDISPMPRGGIQLMYIKGNYDAYLQVEIMGQIYNLYCSINNRSIKCVFSTADTVIDEIKLFLLEAKSLTY